MNWLELQLADSAFPIGGFVHSQGLEAASQFGIANHLDSFFEHAIWQIGFASLPFVRLGAIAKMPIFQACGEADAFLSNAIQNRASRAQGRGVVRVAREAFGDRTKVVELAMAAESTSMHHAPIFGALASALEISPENAAGIFLHGAARNLLSAAVRLGMVGPLEAQRVLAQRAPLLTDVLARCSSLDVGDAAQTSPMFDLAAALHDRLYTRLFQS
jgi:urease accessory protein